MNVLKSEIVLSYNYFIFQNDFIQERGVAPSSANLYMALLEEKIVYSNYAFSTNILIWKRYLDDCFCLFKGEVTQLQYLNSCSDFMPFTIDFDAKRVRKKKKIF